MRARIISYTCPHCRAELEARSDGWDGWRRCPVCASLGMTPTPINLHNGSDPISRAQHEQLVSADAGPSVVVVNPADARQAIMVRSAHSSPARLVFITGLVLSLLMTLIAFLDHKPTRLAIFGFLSICFLLMLLRTPRRRVLPLGKWNGQDAEQVAAANEN